MGINDTDSFQPQEAGTNVMRAGFSNRLNLALDELGWKKSGRASRLCSLLRDKISQPAVRKWLKGGGHPSMPRLEELANLTGRSIEWLLMGGDEDESSSTASRPQPFCAVPVISPHFLLDFANGAPLDESVIDRWIPTPIKVSTQAFAFVHKGLSMQSASGLSYPDGSIVVIDPSVSAHPPCRVLAQTENGAAFKELVEDAGVTFLRSLNPQYPNITMNKQVNIHGVAVCHMTIEPLAGGNISKSKITPKVSVTDEL